MNLLTIRKAADQLGLAPKTVRTLKVREATGY
jgi:hypothetical protein